MRSPQSRKKWMGLLAKAPPKSLSKYFEAVIHDLNAPLAFTWLRPPEIGSVMVQGRAGATGSAFNLGEMTVTRCSLRLSSGEVGHGYVQGRDKIKAEQAAIIDAYMQSDISDAFLSGVIEPIEHELAATRQKRSEKAAKTKVDFFTLVRGED